MSSSKLREGRLKFGEKDFYERQYVFVPSAVLQSPGFNIGEVFKTIDLNVPNIILRINKIQDPMYWNVRLPPHKEKLEATGDGWSDYYTPKSRIEAANREIMKRERPIEHYQGVLRENCKRLLSSTALACKQAGAVFRLSNKWDPLFPEDLSAQWLTSKHKVVLLSLGQESDYHPDVWQALLDGAASDFEEAHKEGLELAPTVIEPSKFMDGTLNSADPQHPNHNPDAGTCPPPGLTHLIISDNMELLEEKINAMVPWGLLMVNGDESSESLFVDAIQDSLPVVVFKYTGYSADITAQMMENALRYHVKNKVSRSEIPEIPYPEDMSPDYCHENWLRKFNPEHRRDCAMVNVLIENWPDRFNETSVCILDMFKHTEDDLQDSLTQTLAVAFEGVNALGDLTADNKRLTYAWRLRYKLMHNARKFHFQSNTLMFWFVLFTLFSTWVAVLYTFVQTSGNTIKLLTPGRLRLVKEVLLKANLLLPLVATIIRGIFSILSPLNKYNVLKDAAAQIESEIYMYRSKVGKYNPRRAQISSNSEDPADASVGTTDPTLPRMLFSIALDNILKSATDGELKNASLETPSDMSSILDAVNTRITTNVEEQNAYLDQMAPYDNEGVLFGFFNKVYKFITCQSDEVPSDSKSGQGIGLLKAHSSSADLGDIEMQDDSHDGEAEVLETIKKAMLLTPKKHKSDGFSLLACFRSETEAEREDRMRLALANMRYDDGLSKLSADDYVKIRLLPLLGEIASKTPSLAKTNTSSAIIVACLSVTSSALSTFGLSVFIPASLALSGAITAWGSYNQSEQRLLQKNIALQRIRLMLVWWDGLTMIEKRVPVNKDTLIRTTEQSILAQATTIGSAGGNNSGDGADEDEQEAQ